MQHCRNIRNEKKMYVHTWHPETMKVKQHFEKYDNYYPGLVFATITHFLLTDIHNTNWRHLVRNFNVFFFIV